MSFVQNIPPSLHRKLARDGADGTEVEAKKTRQDFAQLKEIEEGRRSGTVPAMQDEEGKDINPHMPQYMMQVPWYYHSLGPTLSHQKQQDNKVIEYFRVKDEVTLRKGVRADSAATKFRKGACENCGAITHKKKDCLERPRTIGARFNGKDLAPDEFVRPELPLTFDGKRDRWFGYDVDEHNAVTENFQKMEEARKLLKAKEMEEKRALGEEVESSDDEDEDKYAEHVDMPGNQVKEESKEKQTIRNLRIREDTAKYLLNLDPNSAYYDPKTRSMRDNPLKNRDKQGFKGDTLFIGDNFVRHSGDAKGYAEQQVFAWEAGDKGTDVHLHADPTKTELLRNQFEEKKTVVGQSITQEILTKYGGEEHLHVPPREMLLAQTENYVEYSRDGTVIRGEESTTARSNYEEDVYPNNHTSVWGSFWTNGQWGFACCHSTVKNSYCTGEVGKKLQQETALGVLTTKKDESTAPQKTLVDQHREKIDAKKKKRADKKRKRKEKKQKKKKAESSSSSSDSEKEEEDEDAVREQKVVTAMAAQRASEAHVDKMLTMDERRRPYNSLKDSGKAPTEEEMEAWRRTRVNPDDPMSKFMGLGDDEIL